MRRSSKPIVIASRQSPLARAQAEAVGRALARLYPDVEVRFHWMKSRGDKVTGSLAAAGGKGLFTRGVDGAVLSGEADLAVHSLKDLPADPEEAVPGIALVAVPKRGPVHDCLISGEGYASITELPEGATLGTSSGRRGAQVSRLRPDLRITLLRGNVDTRLGKVGTGGDGAVDATLLAAAGLKRLGRSEHTRFGLSPDEMLPAACQGAIGITCRTGDSVTLTRCLPLNDPAASTAVHAERELVARLGASCTSSLAVLAEPVVRNDIKARNNDDAHWFRLRVRVLAADGSVCLEADERCRTPDLRHVVRQTADRMLNQGAAALLAGAQALGHPA